MLLKLSFCEEKTTTNQKYVRNYFFLITLNKKELINDTYDGSDLILSLKKHKINNVYKIKIIIKIKIHVHYTISYTCM